jgi:hypothetical protein
MARKAGVEVGADFSEIGYAMGTISGMAKKVRTDRYLGDVITYVHSELAALFDEHMDFAVDAAPQRFSHVYEWNPRPGSDRREDRLWRHKILGSGGKRNATFTWRASVKPIPTPQERKNNPNDPMSEVPNEEIERLSKRRYVFYWKAPIMEYNQPVNITPKYAKALFIPTGDPTNPYVFANEFRNLQPGGEQNTGQFTAEWTSWWGAMAPEYFEKYLREGLEKDLAGVEDGIRSGQRTRNKKVSLTATVDYKVAFESGEEWAERYIDKNSRKYKARSKK